MPFKLTVCPLSVAVFFGTAYYLTQEQRKKKADAADDDHGDFLPCCQVVFVLGGPGSGKGTQCGLLETRLDGWTHLSTGDLLRAERKKGGPLGDELNYYINNGQLVPSEVTCKVLKVGMIEAYKRNGKTKFLIDGFPRSFGNATAWEKTMAKHKIQFILNLECPEEVLTGRLLNRGQTSGRTDDTIDVIRKRFLTNQKETAPIIERYEKEGKVKTILADKPVENVYAEVSALFKGL